MPGQWSEPPATPTAESPRPGENLNKFYPISLIENGFPFFLMLRFGSRDSGRQQVDSLTTSLGGVGIVFIQAPDKSLFVKSIVRESSAWHSGVEIGDCLMQVILHETAHVLISDTTLLYISIQHTFSPSFECHLCQAQNKDLHQAISEPS